MSRWASLLSVVLLVAASACTGTSTGAADAGGTEAAATAAEVANPQLRRELLEMFNADQSERTGEPVGVNGDMARADRLREIIDEHGWPTFDLVGTDGATAAWVIAQHADFDVEFQKEALELMRAAVEAGDADPTELGYLEDRVAVNSGQPQTYGTQVSCVGMGSDASVEPATPIADEERVNERRAEVGMEPLEDYFAQMEEGCGAEG